MKHYLPLTICSAILTATIGNQLTLHFLPSSFASISPQTTKSAINAIPEVPNSSAVSEVLGAAAASPQLAIESPSDSPLPITPQAAAKISFDELEAELDSLFILEEDFTNL